MLAFTQARHRMLTENVANVDTPGYQTKHLDAKAFQRALREALDTRAQTGSQSLEIRSDRQFHQDRVGQLVVTPTVQPPENVLFHDQTNMRIEKQMAMLAENAMMHQTVTELLRGKFQELLNAIRGRVA
jgi:flagellar basal-body rod protein FlgB